MLDETTLLRFWGKSDDNDAANWHPLLFHLLDVGNAARCLWDTVLPASTRQQIAAALGLGNDAASARRVVILLTAQHDLGKASSFQTKVPSFWDALKTNSGLTLSDSVPTPPHGFVTTKLLPDFVEKGIGGWSASGAAAKLLARITGGHHGTFPVAADLDPTVMHPRSFGDAAWNAARDALLRSLETHLFSDEDNGSLPTPITLPLPRIDDAMLLPLLGGLISVADWIGSSQNHFPPAGRVDLADYAARSRETAKKALQDFGWTPTPRFAAPASFPALFGFDPNPMQQKVIEVADSQTAPYLLIVEAAMGEGKTEAAVYAIDRALTAKPAPLAHGFYVALPTQATGNAMFARVHHKYLEPEKGKLRHQGNLNLQLVHSGSFTSDAFDKLKFAANSRTKGDDDNGDNGRVIAATWFTARKRPLLAPFGVGTIDQSLTGVLQTKHWFVRLFGLAGKVVVFDEVHAYDIYMGELLGRLLGWLRLLGCTVILLSATLPASKRSQLIDAWNGTAPYAEIPEAAYPRVTLVSKAASNAWHVPAAARPTPAPGKQGRPDAVEVAYAGLDFAALAQTLRADLPHGGCAAVICNTVTRAQEAYQILRDALESEGWTVLLFHARTISKWRLNREKQVLENLGKDSVRPTKFLLIGTQVLEQSLDYDVDWMASEIAPIDLLLQRMGRLWRHERTRPPACKPLFYVLCGGTDDTLPEFPASTDRVYEPYILLRTRLALQPGPVALPGSIEPLINAVYEDPEPTDVTTEWRTALNDARLEMDTKRENHRIEADKVMIPPGHLKANQVLVERELFDDEDPRVHPTVRAATRLGAPSVSLICTGTDADGNPLADPAIVDRTPEWYESRGLIDYSLSTSHPALFHALKYENPPPAWKENAHLRYHRTLPFTDGIASCGKYTLRLSETEGLVIASGNAETPQTETPP